METAGGAKTPRSEAVLRVVIEIPVAAEPGDPPPTQADAEALTSVFRLLLVDPARGLGPHPFEAVTRMRRIKEIGPVLTGRVVEARLAQEPADARP